jgi:hypothetical protein
VIERVRRVVMGEPSPRKAVFTHVEEIEPLETGGMKAWFVWGYDEKPRLPLHGAEPYEVRSWFPPADGLRVLALHMGSDAGAGTKPDAVETLARLHAAEPAGMTSDPDRPGMHRSDSIDIGVIVSGEVITEAEDGTRVVLGPGDVYVQNGAMHNWHSNPDNPAHVVFVVLGAERDDQG